MAKKTRLRKVVDTRSVARCAAGYGLIREEVWVDAEDKIARYNLAFINHFMTAKDNGRVLGYDNSHGHHHRHFKGVSEPFDFESYFGLRTRFIEEVSKLREGKE